MQCYNNNFIKFLAFEVFHLICLKIKKKLYESTHIYYNLLCCLYNSSKFNNFYLYILVDIFAEIQNSNRVFLDYLN